jgi:hypothetical protein
VTTFLAALGALVVAWITHFAAESWKQFNRGSVIAALLSGELYSYQLGYVFSESTFDELSEALIRGEDVTLPKLEPPADFAFDAVVPEIGLLGQEMCRDIAYIYHNLRAFRGNFAVACAQHADLGPVLTGKLIKAAGEARGRAMIKAKEVIVALDQRSKRTWNPLPKSLVGILRKRMP